MMMRTLLYRCIIVWFALTITASAQMSVSQNPDSGIISVAFQGTPGTYAHLQVLKKDQTLEDLMDCPLDSLHTVIAYQQTKITDAAGRVDFSFGMDGDAGNYLVRVNGLGLAEAESKVYRYTLPDTVRNIVVQIIGAASADAVKAILEQAWDSLDVDRNLLAKIDPKGLYQTVYAYQGFDAQKASGFTEYLNQTIILQALSQAAVDDLLYYDGFLKFSLQNAYDTYSKLPGDQKDLVKDAFRNLDVKNETQARNLFNEATILVAVEHIDYWKSLYPLLQKNNNTLNIDFTDYKKLSDTYPVDSAIAKHSFPSLNALKDTFDSLVRETLRTGAGGKSVSPSKASGGGSFHVANPIPEKPELIPGVTANLFDDTDSVAWAAESINRLAQKGIISGVGDRRFAPNEKVLREEIAKMMVNALGLYDENAMSDFSDSSFGDWHYAYISSAYQHKMIQGLSREWFGVGERLLRQDFAAICARGLGLGSAQAEYADADSISGYAKGAVGAMQRAGLMEGAGENMFLPGEAVTRAEAAMVIYRIIQAKEAVQ